MKNGGGRAAAAATMSSGGSDESRKDRVYKLTSLLINITNMSLCAMGLVLFIVGLLYLTVYRYRFSFTQYSIDLVAGWFVALGFVLIVVSIANLIFLLKPFGNPSTALVVATVVFCAFIILFVLSVVGLSQNSNGDFVNQNRNNMIETARLFDERNYYRHETRKINWLQEKFQCCGLDAYTDWQSIMFMGYSYPINYQQQYQNNRMPYVDSVPDSCCIRPSSGCGKYRSFYNQNRAAIINTKGCFSLYNLQFSKDIQFLSALGLFVSLVCLILSVLLLVVFTLIKKNLSLLHVSRNREERRNFI